MTMPPSYDELPPDDPQDQPEAIGGPTLVTSISAAGSPEEEVDLLTQVNINLESVVDQLTVLNVKMERIAQALEKGQPTAQTASGNVVPWRTGVQATDPSGENLPAWECPIHGTFKIVPAGVSKRTNKPYAAFMVCGEQGCDQRPPRS